MRRGDFLALGAFLLLGLVLFLPFQSGERAFVPFHSGVVSPFKANAPDWVADEPHNFNVSDKHYIIHPDQVFTKRELSRGHMPLWNPHQFAGMPHQANPLTGIFYPFTALLAFFDSLLVMAIAMAAHVVLAGLFTYFFLRTLNLRPGAAFFGGLAFSICGWISVHLHHSYFVQGIIWLPLMLGCVEVILQRRARWALMLLAVSIACMWFGGFPQTCVINGYVVLAYALAGLVRHASRRGFRSAGRLTVYLGGFAVLGFLIAMIQLAPTLDLASVAGHQHLSNEQLENDSLRPVTLIHLLVPDFFGHPAEQVGPAEQDNIFAWWLLADGVPTGHITNNYSERSFYPGILVLMLALIAPFFRRDRTVLFFGVALLTSVAFAMSGPLLHLLRRLPGMDFGSPMRLTQVAAFALPVLAACTMDKLLNRAGRRESNHVSMTVLLGAIPVVLLLVACMALWIAPQETTERLHGFLEARQVDRLLGVDQLEPKRRIDFFRNQLVGPPDEAFDSASLRYKLSLCLVLLTASWALLILVAKGRVSKAVVLGLAIALVLADLGRHGYRYNRPVRAEGLYTGKAPGLKFLRENLGDARFIRWDPALSTSLFTPNAPLAFGLSDAQGFRALMPQSYLDFMRTLEPNPTDFGLPNLGDLQSLTSPQLDLLRVKYVVSEYAIGNCPLPQVFPKGDVDGQVDLWIYENLDILPRAFSAHTVHVLPSHEILREFVDLADAPGPSAFKDQVWLDRLLPGMRSRYPRVEPAEEIRVAENGDGIPLDRPGQVTFETKVPVDALLVVSEQYSSGWKAIATMRDEEKPRRRPILRGNHCFMAIPLEA
ncbi:MAG: YfhO family protein, partial [Planctomycetes bacterium]|nr:YfhO family protein [Planctomycetota bacterium]